MDTERVVLVFPQEEVLRADWKKCFTQAGIKVMPFEERLLPQALAVLLFTPVRTPDLTWIAAERVWKTYMTIHFPAIKIIQMGLRKVPDHTNYWHYGPPPSDLEIALAAAVPVGVWEPVPLQGEDLNALWKKFWDGHDKGGFMDWFVTFFRRINIMLDDYEAAPPLLDDPVTLEAFTNTIARWKRYHAYFLAAPFHKELDTIDNAVAQIALFQNISRGAQLKQDLTELSEHLRQVDLMLKKIKLWFTG